MLQKHSETSAGISTESPSINRIGDRLLEIQTSSFNLSFKPDLLQTKSLIALVKCLLILQSLQTLPEAALEEAAEELQAIAHFYGDRLTQSTQSTLPSLPSKIIKGKVTSIQNPPPFILES